MLLTVLSIAQVTSGVVLGAINLIPELHKPNSSDLTPRGWYAFVAAATVLIVTTVWIHVLSERRADAAQARIEVAQARIEHLMQTIAKAVMTPSREPAMTPPAPTGESLRILEPLNGSEVHAIHELRGHLSDGSGQVWAVIHPLDTSSYWVQPIVAVQESGDWQVRGYFGRSGQVDSGKMFEVLAVADPTTELQEGVILEEWPSARLVSDVVTVRRY